MVVLANLGVFSGGMALGYPAVTLKELTDTTRPLYLTASQASWFGKPPNRSLHLLSYHHKHIFSIKSPLI